MLISLVNSSHATRDYSLPKPPLLNLLLLLLPLQPRLQPHLYLISILINPLAQILLTFPLLQHPFHLLKLPIHPHLDLQS